MDEPIKFDDEQTKIYDLIYKIVGEASEKLLAEFGEYQKADNFDGASFFARTALYVVSKLSFILQIFSVENQFVTPTAVQEILTGAFKNALNDSQPSHKYTVEKFSPILSENHYEKN